LEIESIKQQFPTGTSEELTKLEVSCRMCLCASKAKQNEFDIVLEQAEKILIL
jgi:hypothetical protein